MKPEPYLSKKGIVIFKRIESFLKKNEVVEGIDSLRLSQLADLFVKFEEANADMNENGITMTTSTGYEQNRPSWNRYKDCLASIDKLAPKFGLTPAEREKLKSFAVESPVDTRTKEGKMMKLLK